MVKIVELDENDSAGIGLAGSELPRRRKKKARPKPPPAAAEGDGEGKDAPRETPTETPTESETEARDGDDDAKKEKKKKTDDDDARRRSASALDAARQQRARSQSRSSSTVLLLALLFVALYGFLRCVLYTGPRTTASAWWTPILKDFTSRRISAPRVPRFQSRHTSTPFNSASDAFQLHPDVRSYGTTLRALAAFSRGAGGGDDDER
jgi:hypothetical protein